MHECDPGRTIIENTNGFFMVNTRALELGTEPYVLPSQYEQVFYSEVPGKLSWSYIIRYDPRGRPIKYNHVDDEDNHEEEDDDDDLDHEKVVAVDVFDEEAEEVYHWNVVYYDLIDNVDDYISKDAIDDDVDVNEPFMNMYYEPDPDTDVELDKEEDEWHLICNAPWYLKAIKHSRSLQNRILAILSQIKTFILHS